MKRFWTLLCFEVFKPWLISKTKCTLQLQSWLYVSVCNMKINILVSLPMSGPSSSNPCASCFSLWCHVSSRRWRIPGCSASTKGRTLKSYQKITVFKKKKKKSRLFQLVYMHENTALIPVWFVASKCSAWPHLQGRRLKTGQHSCQSQEKVPKQKVLLPRLGNSQVCSRSLFFYRHLPHFLCCSLWHLLGFSTEVSCPQTSKSIANCWAVTFPYQIAIKVRKSLVMKTE